MESLLTILVQIGGGIFMHAAVNYNRSGKSKIKRYTKEWFVMMVYTTIAFILISNAYKWINISTD